MCVSTDESVGLMVLDWGGGGRGHMVTGHRNTFKHEYLTPAFLKSLHPAFSLGMLVCGLWVSGGGTSASLNEGAECCIGLAQ